MRISQIQHIVWTADALALVGVLGAGTLLWREHTHEPRAQVSWESRDDASHRTRRELDADWLSVVYRTPISGWMPALPRTEPPPAPLDPLSEFKHRLTYLGALDVPGRTELSIARVSFDGRALSLGPGDDVGGFQLVEIVVDPENGPARLVFRRCTDGESVSIQAPAKPVAPLTRASAEPFCRVFGDGVAPGAVAEFGQLRGHAFRDPTSGDWVIPEDERLWIEAFGEKDVWENLRTKPDAGADGVSHGLCVLSTPEDGTPLAASHGIAVNDVIRSINDVAITSREDVVNYLRGAGRAPVRYEVVVERDGETKSIVYRVPRRRR